MRSNNIEKLVLTALFTALCFIGTTVIRIPSPFGGYIHPGDGFVLLSGLLLGPVNGAVAAGCGSMLSDLLSGYVVYAPFTLVIKALCAFVCAVLTAKLHSRFGYLNIAVGGAVGEAVMIAGYFIFETFYTAALSGFGEGALRTGLFYGISNVPFNAIQAVTGVVLAVLLYPVLKKAGSSITKKIIKNT